MNKSGEAAPKETKSIRSSINQFLRKASKADRYTVGATAKKKKLEGDERPGGGGGKGGGGGGGFVAAMRE